MDVDALIGRNWLEIRGTAWEAAAGGATCEEAMAWYQHPAWEVRAFAVGVLGRLAAGRQDALAFLGDACGRDAAWQVHEALAMAFDEYCAVTGYEAAIPEMRRWMVSPLAPTRRAVSEGLRPWAASRRAPFHHRPELAIELLGELRDDESRSVQESVGNALRDISRRYPQLVLETVRAWIEERPEAPGRRVIARHALRNAVKDDPALAELTVLPRRS